MASQNLFNSSGDWIAFRVGKHVFDPRGEWIGWLPWSDREREVFDLRGQYLGTLHPGNRLYKLQQQPYHGFPGHSLRPPYPEPPGYPGRPGYSPLPWGASDVTISRPRRV